jgi:hypothetical protein
MSPNEFDLYRNNEILPILKGKVDVNNFDYYAVGEIMPSLMKITAPDQIQPPPKRKLYFID